MKKTLGEELSYRKTRSAKRAFASSTTPLKRMLLTLAVLMFCGTSASYATAQLPEPPPGPAPSVDAQPVQDGAMDDNVKADGKKPAPEIEEPKPNHPPIDQIPPVPMPMPSDKPAGAAAAPAGKGSAVYHNAATNETFVAPPMSAASMGSSGMGGGYSGPDGGDSGPFGDSEMTPAYLNGNMSLISNTQDHPWRMNVKVVLNFGGSWYVCSGTMSDAETVLTAGHCVYDYGGAGWASEIYVYPGWDGVSNPPIVQPYGYAHSTYYGTWSNWANNGDWNGDIGVIKLDRAVGMLTGWFGWSYGGDCSWHTSTTYNNASYPAEYCGGSLHNGADMYYWSGNFNTCPDWNRLGLYTTGGCLNAIWGGMSGSGAYYIDGNRYVHAVTSTSNRYNYAEYTRQWDAWIGWTTGTFIPDARGASFDLQALDTNALPATINAGASFTTLNHLATNPTNGTANGTWNFGAYLSTNSTISTADTALGFLNYAWDFGAMSSVTVNFGGLTVPKDTPTGDYYLGVVYDCGTDIDCSNNDSSDWDAVPIHVNGMPDLTILSTTTSTSSPKPGDPVDVTVTIKNEGGAAATSFWVDIFKDLASAPVAPQYGDAWCYFSSLAPGETTTCTRTVSYAMPGSYNLWALVDSGAQITESVENNNASGPKNIIVPIQYTLTTSASPTAGGTVSPSCESGCLYSDNTVVAVSATANAGYSFSSWSGACSGTGACNVTMNANKSVTANFTPLNVPKVDLTTTVLSGPTAKVKPGTVVTVNTTIKNSGPDPAPASTANIYWSSNATLDAGDILIGTRAVPALAAGAINAGSTSVTIPASGCSGTFYFIAKADGPDAIIETNEVNNTKNKSAITGPDLIVSIVTAPTTGGEGKIITVGDTTKNNDNGCPAAASSTGFYISTNNTWDAGDIYLGARALPALAAGAVNTGTISVTIPAGVSAGTNYIIAKADNAGVVAELIETNNTKPKAITIGTDLIVSTVTAPATGGAGQTITVGDTTKNNGGGGAGASVTAYYLSVDNAWDAGDQYLGERAVPAIAAGAVSTGSVSVTIPAGTATGSYFIIARADAYGVVPELIETNNIKAKAIKTGPDLIVASIIAPTSAVRGTTISVNDVTKNIGKDTAGASTTKLYLSSNITLDVGDTYLGERAVPAIAAGATNSGTTGVLIPTSHPVGVYYIIAVSDANSAVVELIETNNNKTKTITLN